MSVEFQPFPKIARLSRDCIITEKIDGTNASILIGPNGEFQVASRTRWITPTDDNYGFAAWAYLHRDELLGLGEGHHFGEWWGKGIQRNYAQPVKRFSLFNTSRWADVRDREKYPLERPICCDVVPVLYSGPFEKFGVLRGVQQTMTALQEHGSLAAPGFMQPEGICVYHVALGIYMKKTLEKDASPKGQQ